MNKGSTMALPSLTAIETFLSVARHGSFRKAATERRVSPSALSHVIRGLEDTIGLRLFNRNNRSVRLTQAGEHLLHRFGPAVSDIAEAIDQVRASHGRPSGVLRLNVPRTVADLIIKPILGPFLRAYPDISLQVVSHDGLVDIIAEGFDAGIRPGRLVAQDMVAVPVGEPRRFAVVGSPDYFAVRGKPLVPADLHDHACIARGFPGGGRYVWEFGRGDDMQQVEITGPLVVDDSALMVAAALAGVGLAFVHDGFANRHLLEGTLVRVLEDWCEPLSHFFLYYPGRRQVPAQLRAFIDMVRAKPV
jgi:DNA-binding transcriptional LysR family regulator